MIRIGGEGRAVALQSALQVAGVGERVTQVLVQIPISYAQPPAQGAPRLGPRARDGVVVSGRVEVATAS